MRENAMAHEFIDLDRLRDDLQAAFPHIQIAKPLRLLGFGFHSLVLETPHGMVFRIAKNWDATAGQAKEARLLPFLQTKLPVTVPSPQWYVGPCTLFPFGVIGYLKIGGITLQPHFLDDQFQASLVETCASFLYALHTIPSDEVQQLGIPGPFLFWTRLERLRIDVLPVLRAMLPDQDYSQMEQWWDIFLADELLRQATSCLCHGDLWYENMLVDATDHTVTGILDFEDTVIADPALDFAALLYLGKSFTSAVIEAYQALGAIFSENLAYRIARYWEVRDFEGLQFAIKYANRRELTDALRKLRHGPILHPERRFC
jgi:aminoglycoside 2''-phosphotransferase